MFVLALIELGEKCTLFLYFMGSSICNTIVLKPALAILALVEILHNIVESLQRRWLLKTLKGANGSFQQIE